MVAVFNLLNLFWVKFKFREVQKTSIYDLCDFLEHNFMHFCNSFMFYCNFFHSNDFYDFALSKNVCKRMDDLPLNSNLTQLAANVIEL